MVNNVYSIPVNKITKDLVMTIKITGMGRWKCRLWMGRQLIKLAALLMEVGIKFENEE